MRAVVLVRVRLVERQVQWTGAVEETGKVHRLRSAVAVPERVVAEIDRQLRVVGIVTVRLRLDCEIYRILVLQIVVAGRV